jgi:hypothetical protein
MRDAIHDLLGERFGESRIADDGAYLVTVIDMTADDVDAIGRIARDAGTPDDVRTQRADPAALRAWEEVRQELIRLREIRNDALQGYPGPGPRYRKPPFDIGLSAYAVDVAAALHERFGEWVTLRVGALAYPRPSASRRRAAKSLPTIDPAEIRIALADAVVISSGHTKTYPLKVTNLGDSELVVQTNGNLIAEVVDPQSGFIVGGYAGGHLDMLVPFRIPPNSVIRIPLLIGTASFEPELGYAVPAGNWALRTMLKLMDGRTFYTPFLPFVVTE